MAKGTFSNPFSPFNIFGALATTGAQGARGAYEGIFGGEEARRRFLAEDEANRIRALQAILLGKQVDQFGKPSYKVDAQGRIVLETPGQPPKMVGELPQSQYGQARLDLLGEQAKLAEGRTSLAEERQKMLAEGGGKALSPTTILGKIQQKAIERGMESLTPVERALFDRGEKGAKEPTNLDQLIIKANDPRMSAEERARAKQEAQAIISARKEMTTFNINARTEAGGKEFDRRTGIRDQIKQAQEERKKQFAALSTDQKREAAIGDLNQLRDMAKGINDAGLLPPSGASGFGVWWANKKRDWLDPTNDSLVSFRGMFGPIMVGEIDRSVYDEKGIRAMQAFKQQFDMVEKMPSYSALDSLFKEIEASIRRKQAGGATPSGVAPGVTAAPRPAAGGGGVVKWTRDAQGNPVPASP